MSFVLIFAAVQTLDNSSLNSLVVKLNNGAFGSGGNTDRIYFSIVATGQQPDLSFFNLIVAATVECLKVRRVRDILCLFLPIFTESWVR